MAAPDTLYGAVSTIFQFISWLWIGLGGIIALLIAVTAFRARHSAWVRKGEFLPPARVTTPIADPDTKVA